MGDAPSQPIDFAEAFVRHHRALWLVAMSVVENGADADDVLQESAIIGLRKFGVFVQGTSYLAWMGEIVRNVALNRRRQVRRHQRRLGASVDAQQAEVPGRAGTSSPVTARGELRRDQTELDDRLTRALAELEPSARACVLLRTIEGLEYSEIAQVLGLPKGTAMSHVFRARRALAARLGEQHGPGAGANKGAQRGA